MSKSESSTRTQNEENDYNKCSNIKRTDSSGEDKGYVCENMLMLNKNYTSQFAFGPALPLNLQSANYLSPEEPTSMLYGPTLPPLLKKSTIENSEFTSDKIKKLDCERILNNPPCNSVMIGPKLPFCKSDESSDLKELDKAINYLDEPLLIETQSTIYGPTLPQSLINNFKKQNSQNTDRENEIFTKINNINKEMLPSKIEKCLDDEWYGPLPVGIGSTSKAHIALEERALKMKIDKMQKIENTQTTREKWMIELPEVHCRNIGLGPRQFKANPGPDFSDRSSWTDTPQNKTQCLQNVSFKGNDIRGEAKRKEQESYNQEQEKIAKRHKKHKKEKSLLEIHQSNLNKQKNDKEHAIRKPFSRDTDLKVNYFDEAQRKTILKNAQLLNDRFSSGQSKFL